MYAISVSSVIVGIGHYMALPWRPDCFHDANAALGQQLGGQVYLPPEDRCTGMGDQNAL